MPIPVITQPTFVGLHELARRRSNVHNQQAQRKTYKMKSYIGEVPLRTREMICVQDQYDVYKDHVRQQCSEQFWRLFLALHTQSAASIDAALGTTRKIFLTPHSEKWKMWPASRRELFKRIGQVRDFWIQVSHKVDIDISSFKLPSGSLSMQFEFIDPIWAWIVAARRQPPADLHWVAIEQPEVPEYGAGIQYGQAFREACKSCPQPNSYPMCISIHWDGTSAHGLSASPICIGVANTNTQRADAHFCIGYVPHTPDAKKITQVVCVM